MRSDRGPRQCPPVILASASPRRRELLRALGIEHDAIATEIDELTEAAGDPAALVLENARRKAAAGLAARPGGAPLWVIAADTEVALDGRVFGKAADREAARDNLRALAGRTHQVLSGLVVCAPDGERREGVEQTELHFREFADHELERYLDSGEWRDRAGSFAVQGLGSMFIDRIDGDLATVIGLPIGLLMRFAPQLFGLSSVS